MISTPKLYKYIGEKIREKRIELKLSQQVLGNKIGKNRASISNIESGKHQVSIIDLYRISEILEYDVHLFFPSVHKIQDDNITSRSNENLVDLELKSLLDELKFSTEVKENLVENIINL